MTYFPYRCEATVVIRTEPTPALIGFGSARCSSLDVPAGRLAPYPNYLPENLSTLTAAERTAEPRLTANDRSDSAGSERSSVGLEQLVGWNPRSNLLRLRNGGIGLKLGAAKRVEKRLGRALRHGSLLFRHGLFERRVH